MNTVSRAALAHTPGPWSCASAYGRYGRSIVSDDGVNIGHVQTEQPAHGDSSYGATEPLPYGEANARLIAAAPELLAALQQIIADPFAQQHLTPRLILEGSAALAKAGVL